MMVKYLLASFILAATTAFAVPAFADGEQTSDTTSYFVDRATFVPGKPQSELSSAGGPTHFYKIAPVLSSSKKSAAYGASAQYFLNTTEGAGSFALIASYGHITPTGGGSRTDRYSIEADTQLNDNDLTLRKPIYGIGLRHAETNGGGYSTGIIGQIGKGFHGAKLGDIITLVPKVTWTSSTAHSGTTTAGFQPEVDGAYLLKNIIPNHDVTLEDDYTVNNKIDKQATNLISVAGNLNVARSWFYKLQAGTDHLVKGSLTYSFH